MCIRPVAKRSRVHIISCRLGRTEYQKQRRQQTQNAAPSYTDRQDHRRDRPHHVSHGVRGVFDILLYPLHQSSEPLDHPVDKRVPAAAQQAAQRL